MEIDQGIVRVEVVMIKLKIKRRSYLQYSEVFQYTVHHVFLRQLFKLVNKIDHVLAHWGFVDSVDKPTVFIVSKLSLQQRNGKKFNSI